MTSLPANNPSNKRLLAFVKLFADQRLSIEDAGLPGGKRENLKIVAKMVNVC